MQIVQRILAPVTLAVGLATASLSWAADRASVVNFLEITGFDVAIESIALNAEGAPSMLGLENDAFGLNWTFLAEQVFVPEDMKTQAVDILEATLDQDLLDHGVAFYASDLGKRLVHAENLSHMDDDELKQIAGAQLVEMMTASDDPKLPLFERMSLAIDPKNTGLKAIQEIQVRFIMAAAHAGVIELRVDEEALRARLKEGQEDVIRDMLEGAVEASAYTYQGFSTEEIAEYTDALENPKMQLVYELMNAVHYQIMADRFDALSKRLDQLRPSEDL